MFRGLQVNILESLSLRHYMKTEALDFKTEIRGFVFLGSALLGITLRSLD